MIFGVHNGYSILLIYRLVTDTPRCITPIIEPPSESLLHFDTPCRSSAMALCVNCAQFPLEDIRNETRSWEQFNWNEQVRW